MKKQDFHEKVAQIWWVLYLIGGVGSKKIWALGPKIFLGGGHKLAFLAIYSPVCHLPQLCPYSEKFKKNVRKIRPRPHLRFWRPSLEISAALTWVFGGPHLSFWRRPLIGWSRQASLEILAALTWDFRGPHLSFWRRGLIFLTFLSNFLV